MIRDDFVNNLSIVPPLIWVIFCVLGPLALTILLISGLVKGTYRNIKNDDPNDNSRAGISIARWTTLLLSTPLITTIVCGLSGVVVFWNFASDQRMPSDLDLVTLIILAMVSCVIGIVGGILLSNFVANQVRHL